MLSIEGERTSGALVVLQASDGNFFRTENFFLNEIDNAAENDDDQNHRAIIDDISKEWNVHEKAENSR